LKIRKTPDEVARLAKLQRKFKKQCAYERALARFAKELDGKP
jgi:hypothetical protein